MIQALDRLRSLSQLLKPPWHGVVVTKTGAGGAEAGRALFPMISEAPLCWYRRLESGIQQMETLLWLSSVKGWAFTLTLKHILCFWLSLVEFTSLCVFWLILAFIWTQVESTHLTVAEVDVGLWLAGFLLSSLSSFSHKHISWFICLPF